MHHNDLTIAERFGLHEDHGATGTESRPDTHAATVVGQDAAPTVRRISISGTPSTYLIEGAAGWTEATVDDAGYVTRFRGTMRPTAWSSLFATGAAGGADRLTDAGRAVLRAADEMYRARTEARGAEARGEPETARLVWRLGSALELIEELRTTLGIDREADIVAVVRELVARSQAHDGCSSCLALREENSALREMSQSAYRDAIRALARLGSPPAQAELTPPRHYPTRGSLAASHMAAAHADGSACGETCGVACAELHPDGRPITLGDRLLDYARQMVTLRGSSTLADAIEAMVDSPGAVSADVGCEPAEVLLWCEGALARHDAPESAHAPGASPPAERCTMDGVAVLSERLLHAAQERAAADPMALRAAVWTMATHAPAVAAETGSHPCDVALWCEAMLAAPPHSSLAVAGEAGGDSSPSAASAEQDAPLAELRARVLALGSRLRGVLAERPLTEAWLDELRLALTERDDAYARLTEARLADARRAPVGPADASAPCVADVASTGTVSGTISETGEEATARVAPQEPHRLVLDAHDSVHAALGRDDGALVEYREGEARAWTVALYGCAETPVPGGVVLVEWEETAPPQPLRVEFRRADLQAPIDVVLHCPRCRAQHIDVPEPERGWTNPPHRSHLCHACGLIWRPADVCTNGVKTPSTRGRRDTWTGPDSWAPPSAPQNHHEEGVLAASPPTRSREDWIAIAASSPTIGALPYVPDPTTSTMIPPSPEAWAAHVLRHAEALQRSVASGAAPAISSVTRVGDDVHLQALLSAAAQTVAAVRRVIAPGGREAMEGVEKQIREILSDIPEGSARAFWAGEVDDRCAELRAIRSAADDLAVAVARARMAAGRRAQRTSHLIEVEEVHEITCDFRASEASDRADSPIDVQSGTASQISAAADNLLARIERAIDALRPEPPVQEAEARERAATSTEGLLAQLERVRAALRSS